MKLSEICVQRPVFAFMLIMFLVGSLVSLLAGMALGFLMLLVLKHGQHVARLHCAIAGSIAP